MYFTIPEVAVIVPEFVIVPPMFKTPLVPRVRLFPELIIMLLGELTTVPFTVTTLFIVTVVLPEGTVPPNHVEPVFQSEETVETYPRIVKGVLSVLLPSVATILPEEDALLGTIAVNEVGELKVTDTGILFIVTEVPLVKADP